MTQPKTQAEANIKGSKSKVLIGILAVLSQVLILAILIFSQQLTVYKGNRIYLKLEPVDPRDPFRGDYLILNYKISNIEKELYSYYNNSDPKAGQDINVVLYNSSGNKRDWTPVCEEISNLSSCDGVGDIFGNYIKIKGRINSVINKGCSGDIISCNYPIYDLTVKYGIEEYFIPENSGRNLPSFENAYGVVYVDNTGKAVLKYVEVDGKKWPYSK